SFESMYRILGKSKPGEHDEWQFVLTAGGCEPRRSLVALVVVAQRTRGWGSNRSQVQSAEIYDSRNRMASRRGRVFAQGERSRFPFLYRCRVLRNRRDRLAGR